MSSPSGPPRPRILPVKVYSNTKEAKVVSRPDSAIQIRITPENLYQMLTFLGLF
jgi:hypothetical protein